MGGSFTLTHFVNNEKSMDVALTKSDANLLVKNKTMGIMMIETAHDRKFGEIKRSLQNSMVEGNNRYLVDKATAYTMISKFQPERQRGPNGRETTTSGVSFYQRADPMEGPPMPGTNGVLEAIVQCWRCGRNEHLSLFCPNVSDGFQGMQYMFNQTRTQLETFMKDSWLLIDTGST